METTEEDSPLKSMTSLAIPLWDWKGNETVVYKCIHMMGILVV